MDSDIDLESQIGRDAPIAPVEKPAADDVRPSIDETLRETYARIKNRPVEDEAPEPKPAADSSDAGRDEKGRFAPRKPATAQASPQGAPSPGDTPAPAADPSQPRPPDPNAAPSSWSAPAKALWATLPEAARAEIVKREDQFHKGIEQYKGAAQFGHSIAKTIEPYLPNIQRSGQNSQQALESLLRVDHHLRNSPMETKRQLIAQIAQAYGVTYEDARPGAQPAQMPQPHDPFGGQDPRAVIESVTRQTLEREREQARAHEAQSEIDAFAGSKDKYGVMNDWQQQPDGSQVSPFRRLMAAAFNNGLATTLDEAYEVAARAHPQVYARMTAEQQATAEKARKDAAAQRVITARRASAPNVKTIGIAGGPGQPKTTMDETIRNKARELGVYSK